MIGSKAYFAEALFHVRPAGMFRSNEISNSTTFLAAVTYTKKLVENGKNIVDIHDCYSSLDVQSFFSSKEIFSAGFRNYLAVVKEAGSFIDNFIIAYKKYLCLFSWRIREQ